MGLGNPMQPYFGFGSVWTRKLAVSSVVVCMRITSPAPKVEYLAAVGDALYKGCTQSLPEDVLWEQSLPFQKTPRIHSVPFSASCFGSRCYLSAAEDTTPLLYHHELLST